MASVAWRWADLDDENVATLIDSRGQTLADAVSERVATIVPGRMPVSVTDATAPRTGERLDLGLGHVGMVVGARGREKLWEPLAAWLSRAAAKC